MSKKLIQAAAGAGGESVYVEDVFSTYLYTGADANETVTNGIDLAGEGGFVWIKPRTSTGSHLLFDTERGTGKYLVSSSTAAEATYNPYLSSFNSDGFTTFAFAPADYASWSFRKQAGFFDVVTYTGDGSVQSVNHNLGSVPACMIVKRTDSTGDWYVYHVDLGAGINGRKALKLNETSAASDSGGFSDHPTDTAFTVNYAANTSGATYVAYLFAHDDQSFGDNSDESIIKCGSFTLDGSGNPASVNLGWEPQWLLVKRTDSSTAGNWYMEDMMRGIPVTGNGAQLYANTTGAESASNIAYPNATGFTWNIGIANYSGIYIAIRRPMKTPEAGTDVFNVNYNGSTGDGNVPAHRTTFPVDMFFWKDVNNSGSDIDWFLFDRLRGMSGKALHTNTTDAEGADPYPASWEGFDLMDGVIKNTSSYTDYYAWMFKRATGFFDVVAYTGDGTSSRSLNHNLGVAPELMIIKQRSATRSWAVYSSATGTGKFLKLEDSAGVVTQSGVFDTAPTSSVFTVDSNTYVNISGGTYIAYLFATVAGVSKVGSYTGTGSSQTIDCGFSSGARFVLIKRTDSSGNWLVFDTVRGIAVGDTDGVLTLDTTTQEYSESAFFSNDVIQPDSSGFKILSNASLINDSGASYIFLAIA